ncbi:hypothetical protein D9757_005554 [Collybiopsis confluens]|uniref:Glycosyltransferase 2-like domain-containing protein n=1 Tax=Collybiopsis confluens TaxID=2823264 RepID=A0A8H5HLK8_9AGAR|nr:hypothetical protein D9757_005554 [Collybiopsis confluens]
MKVEGIVYIYLLMLFDVITTCHYDSMFSALSGGILLLRPLSAGFLSVLDIGGFRVYDAFLHFLFKELMRDAWFKPEEEVSSGVATAITLLNPVVAVKVRNAAAHAALAGITQDDNCIFVDAETRIQVLDTMAMLPHADKEQCAAFIRDERVLVIWSDSLHNIVPIYHDLEGRLIKLLWRPAPGGTPTLGTPKPSSTIGTESPSSCDPLPRGNSRAESNQHQQFNGGEVDGDINGGSGLDPPPPFDEPEALEDLSEENRPVQLLAPIYTGVSAGLALVFMGASIESNFPKYSQSIAGMDKEPEPIIGSDQSHTFIRTPAVKPRPNKIVDNNLPHITIQMPVYKESLESVLIPSVQSIKRAMQTYARQGGSSALFVNDDGLRSLPSSERNKRIAYYAEQNIGWVARPVHSDAPDGFKRAGRFKKASNMNYALNLSQKLERHLMKLMAEQKVESPRASKGSSSMDKNRFSSFGRYGLHYQNFSELASSVETKPDSSGIEDLEEKALYMAIEEVHEANNRKFAPWAANGKACRIGEIILLVDSDTMVPSDCLRDAAREMKSSPTVAIIQHESGGSTRKLTDILKVAHHYFENGMAYLTHRVTRTISMACANGEVPPFLGQFLRWSAIQDAAFINAADGVKKFWSECNVSEDFDMALRLLGQGYILRWATYSKGEFKEGVSLSVEDERNRWQKAPIHYKLSALAYGIAASFTIAVLNYVLLGFEFPVDGFYTHNFEIWLTCIVVFFGSGSVGYSLFEYRVGSKSLAILAHMFSYNISWSATVKEVRRSNFFKEIPQIYKRRHYMQHPPCSDRIQSLGIFLGRYYTRWYNINRFDTADTRTPGMGPVPYVAPIDVVKTRIQVDPKFSKFGFVSGTRYLIAQEGPSALLTGFGPTAVGYLLQGGAKFAGYEYWKKYFVTIAGDQETAIKYRTAIYLGSASVAEFFADILLTPLEATRIRLVSERGYATGLASGFTRLAREGGVSQLYAGFLPILCKQIPYAIGQFTVNEFCHELAFRNMSEEAKRNMSDLSKFSLSLGSGVIAGFAAAILSHPADTLLSQINKGHGPQGSMIYRLTTLAKEAGFKGMFVGLGPRMIMTAGLVSSQFLMYDAIKHALGAPPGLEIHKE